MVIDFPGKYGRLRVSREAEVFCFSYQTAAVLRRRFGPLDKDLAFFARQQRFVSLEEETMSEPVSILLFDNPVGMQLIEQVLRKIGVPYETPPYSSEDPILMIHVMSNRSSRKTFEACKEYFAIEGPILSTGFTPSGGFTMTPVWEFKLLSMELKLESIPQVAEHISNPTTE